MSRIWQSGPGVPVYWAEFTSGGITNLTWTTDPTYLRFGPYALLFTGQGYVIKEDLSIPDGAAQRAYIRLNAQPLAGSRVMGLLNATGHLSSLTLRPDRRLELNLDGPAAAEIVVATSPFAVPIGNYNCYELWCQHTTPKVIATQFNGVEWARYTPTSFAAGSGPITRPYFGPDEAATSGCNLSYVDMAVNSLVGTYNNGWPGPSGGGVQTYRPVPGTLDLTPGSWTISGAPTVGDALDETTPNDATDYVVDGSGISGAACGFGFPDWPLRGPAAAVLFGVRGGGSVSTDCFARLQLHDPADAQLGGIGPDINWNTGGTWKSVFPALTIEEALDGTRRMISNKYLYPSAHPGLWAPSSRARAILVRRDSFAGRNISITAVWMSVDFPYAEPAGLAPTATAPQPVIHATVDPA